MTIEELAAELDRRIADRKGTHASLTHGAKPTPGQRAELATLQEIRNLIDIAPNPAPEDDYRAMFLKSPGNSQTLEEYAREAK